MRTLSPSDSSANADAISVHLLGGFRVAVNPAFSLTPRNAPRTALVKALSFEAAIQYALGGDV
jgi:hypothetical protein